MKRIHFKLIKNLGVAALSVLLAGTLFTAASADVIRVGVIGPMTGPAADTGRLIKYSSQLAADEINAKGGILGRKIELFYADDESNPAAGVSEVTKLIEREKINILTGGLHSDVALATMEVTPRYGIPYVISGPVSQSIADKIAKDTKKYFMVFKADTSSLVLGSSWADYNDFLVNEKVFTPKEKTFAMIVENTDYGRSVAAAAEKAMIAKGWKKLHSEVVDIKLADFYPILSKIKKANPAILWSVQTGTASGLALIKQFREMSFPALFESTYVSTKPDYLKLVGADGAGVIGLYSAGLLPGVSDPFVEKFQKRFGDKPGLVDGIQYDVMYMVKEAYERAGSLDPQKFTKEFAKTKYQGNLGTYIFSPKDHQVLSGVDYLPSLIFQIQKDGKTIMVYPPKYSQGKYAPPSWLK